MFLQGDLTNSEENPQNGRRDFVQTIKYFPEFKHNDQVLKCVVNHPEYTKAAINEGRNMVEKKLELRGKFACC